MKKILPILLLFFFANLYSQKSTREYNNLQIQKNKIFNNKYTYWGPFNRFNPTLDTLHYFVEDYLYKGIHNYNLKITNENLEDKVIIEDISKSNIEVKFQKIIFSFKDSIIEIEGIIKDGWNGKGYNGQGNSVNIFIGNYRDTISLKYLDIFSYDKKVKVFKNNFELDKNTPIDSFPSIYLINFKHIKSKSGNQRQFKIKSKINHSSILLFGLKGHYSAIYDLGSLINKRKINNKNIDANQSKVIRSLKDNNSYNFLIDSTEIFIAKKQYSKAAKLYDKIYSDFNYFFAIDLHNVIRVHLKLNDFKKVLFFSKLLINKGVKMSYFESSEFISFKKSKYWDELKSNYRETANTRENKINLKLLNQINNLVDRDQSLFTRNSLVPINREVLLDSTNLLVNDLIDLIKCENCFPTEEIIGVNMLNDTVIAYNSKFKPIIVHANQLKSERFEELNKIILDNCEKLNYDCRRNDPDVFLGQPDLIVYKGKLYVKKGVKVNKNKVILIEYSIKKMKYNFKLKTNYRIYAVDNPEDSEEETLINSSYNFVKILTDDWFFYEKF